jgi:hypothetical protein
MTVPSRPERHREIKQASKELQWIQKHSSFGKLFDEFGQYNTEQIQQLANKENPDKELQERFNTFKTLWDRGVSLASRIEYLKEGYKKELKNEK